MGVEAHSDGDVLYHSVGPSAPSASEALSPPPSLSPSSLLNFFINAVPSQLWPRQPCRLFNPSTSQVTDAILGALCMPDIGVSQPLQPLLPLRGTPSLFNSNLENPISSVSNLVAPNPQRATLKPTTP